MSSNDVMHFSHKTKMKGSAGTFHLERTRKMVLLPHALADECSGGRTGSWDSLEAVRDKNKL